MVQTVDVSGRPVTLSSRQKNEIYSKAKDLRSKIQEKLLTRDEHWKPTDKNVEKFCRTEGSRNFTDLVNSYRSHMQAIGCDSNDLNIDQLRKQKITMGGEY